MLKDLSILCSSLPEVVRRKAEADKKTYHHGVSKYFFLLFLSHSGT